MKRMVFYTGYAVGDVDFRQGTAVRVFVTHCISIDFVLDDRKVISTILVMKKRMKI